VWYKDFEWGVACVVVYYGDNLVTAGCCVLLSVGLLWFLCVVVGGVDLCFNMLLGLFSPIVTLLLYVFCSTA